MREEDRSDIQIVLQQIGLRNAKIGPKELSQVGQVNRFAAEADFDRVMVSRNACRTEVEARRGIAFLAILRRMIIRGGTL